MERTFRITSRALWRREGDGIVILDEVSGEPYLLDAVAADVFELFDGGSSLADALRRLGERYDGDPAEMEQDVKDLLDELGARKLLEVVEG